MDANWPIAIILCLLIVLSLISLVILKKVELRMFFIDTALITVCLAFCAVAYFTAVEAFFIGIIVYVFRLTNSDNIIKFVFLFSGLIIGYFTGNDFYTNTSILILAIFIIIRLVESIVEISLYTPDSEPITGLDMQSKKSDD
ncbi:hypothetical protein CXK86_20695 [Paenibacillus sp. BGI2013]|uniref:hypothetical protein n=1 Tax=Paenibacillus sp. BGI2013 TaxID=2058902 RepID=UPI000C6DE768|nr:hypothetical protein [Paenibacillus sp. BGI2013]PKQ89465.1 hypothetical protein CXK86_20695 [Paenibacillus sp. BGI2013]